MITSKNEFEKKIKQLKTRRYRNLRDLESFLTTLLNTKEPIWLEHSNQNYEADHTPDWNVIGHYENKYIFCDFDIYFLYDRYSEILVTEINCTFE